MASARPPAPLPAIFTASFSQPCLMSPGIGDCLSARRVVLFKSVSRLFRGWWCSLNVLVEKNRITLSRVVHGRFCGSCSQLRVVLVQGSRIFLSRELPNIACLQDHPQLKTCSTDRPTSTRHPSRTRCRGVSRSASQLRAACGKDCRRSPQ